MPQPNLNDLGVDLSEVMGNKETADTHMKKREWGGPYDLMETHQQLGNSAHFFLIPTLSEGVGLLYTPE